MVVIRRQMNLPQIQRILQEFEKQSDVMDMKEEIMNEAIDDAMGDEADEEERFGLNGFSRIAVISVKKIKLFYRTVLVSVTRLCLRSWMSWAFN